MSEVAPDLLNDRSPSPADLLSRHIMPFAVVMDLYREGQSLPNDTLQARDLVPMTRVNPIVEGALLTPTGLPESEGPETNPLIEYAEAIIRDRELSLSELAADLADGLQSQETSYKSGDREISLPGGKIDELTDRIEDVRKSVRAEKPDYYPPEGSYTQTTEGNGEKMDLTVSGLQHRLLSFLEVEYRAGKYNVGVYLRRDEKGRICGAIEILEPKDGNPNDQQLLYSLPDTTPLSDYTWYEYELLSYVLDRWQQLTQSRAEPAT